VESLLNSATFHIGVEVGLASERLGGDGVLAGTVGAVLPEALKKLSRGLPVKHTLDRAPDRLMFCRESGENEIDADAHAASDRAEPVNAGAGQSSSITLPSARNRSKSLRPQFFSCTDVRMRLLVLVQ
jgi:hypothetical protein